MKPILIFFFSLLFLLIGLTSPINAYPSPSGGAEGGGSIPPRQPSANQRVRSVQQLRESVNVVRHGYGDYDMTGSEPGDLSEYIQLLSLGRGGGGEPHPRSVPANTSNTRRNRQGRRSAVPANANNTRTNRDQGSSSRSFEEEVASVRITPTGRALIESLRELERLEGHNDNNNSRAGDSDLTPRTNARLEAVLREPGAFQSLKEAFDNRGKSALVERLGIILYDISQRRVRGH